jgi:hypothetical protein
LADSKSWQSSLIYWNNYKYPYPKWIDVYINECEFIRNIDKFKYHIQNGIIKYWERLYNFPDMITKYPDKVYDDKIGSLDF